MFTHDAFCIDLTFDVGTESESLMLLMWSQICPKTTCYVYVCMYVCLSVLTARQRDEQNPLERVAQQERQEQERDGERDGEGEEREEVDGGEQEASRVEADGGEIQVWLVVLAIKKVSYGVCGIGRKEGGRERER